MPRDAKMTFAQKKRHKNAFFLSNFTICYHS